MGAGKSTLGKALSEATGWPYFDNDGEMTRRYGLSQEELASLPVPELHALESRYLFDVTSQAGPLISGAAASVVDYEENREILKGVSTIYLCIPLSSVISRAGTHGVGRQALSENAEQVLTERYIRRDPLYREVSIATLELGDNPAEDAARLIALVSSL